MYDVVIVGAGPAGLFSAYELVTKTKLQVLQLTHGIWFLFIGQTLFLAKLPSSNNKTFSFIIR